ncbi:MAG: hypothetical protein A2W25_11990 [candidate division Zixibacteria bacterium RBG_16_53_22]|nr:MAG: hypothetical protein A2W25_11990 [candidate division Zixibacteria bacterium RBG_16_53_22]
MESGLGLATNLYIYLTPPSGVDKTKAAVLSSNGSDGKMQYVTVNGDLDETGSWQIQGYIKFSNSQIFKTSVRQFNVLANLVP